MSYSVTLPDGRTVEFPDDVPKEKAAQLIQSQFPEFAPKTTIGGNVKELFKGLVPGAVNMTQSAVAGAASLLPEEQEQSVRETTRNIADSIRKPFAASPGYEQSPGRKLGEGVGSTAPFFALGPLGMAGRVAAGGMGAAAGAGEARVRAEQDGANSGQRGLSTALGAAVGATEILPVFKFLEHLSTPVKEGIFNYIRRAAVTGGAEGAQEASAQILQNLIAKGVYKPDQAIVEGSGEAGAYGAGVGALIQGLTDAALGRRGNHGQVVDGETPIDKARREEATARAAKAGTAPPPAGEQGPLPADYGELKQHEQRLMEAMKGKRPSPADKAELARVREALKQLTLEGYNRKVPETNPDLLSAEEAGQPDLFGEYVPKAEDKSEDIPEPTVRYDDRQRQLPFSDSAQPELFEELPPGEVDPEAANTSLNRTLETPPTVGYDKLASIGVPRQSKFMKQLGDTLFRMDRTSDVNKLLSGLETLLENRATSQATIAKVAPFVNYLRRQQLALPGFEETTDATETDAGNGAPAVAADGNTSVSSVPVSGNGNGKPRTRGASKAVVSGVGDTGAPAGNDVRGTPPLQPTLSEPLPAKKTEYEPPLVSGITPEQEQAYRGKLAEHKAALKPLETARDAAEERLQIAEFTGNEAEQMSAAAELEAANKEFYKAAKRAESAYYKLYDKEKSEFEGAIGEAYIDDYQADKAKRKAIARGEAQPAPKYPYNITDLATLDDEIEYNVPNSLPEFKEWRKKYFTKNGDLKNKVHAEDAIKAGHELLKTVVMPTVSRNSEGDPVVSLAVEQLIDSRADTNTILKFLSHSGSSPFYKALAKAYLKLPVHVPVRIDTSRGGKYLAVFDEGNNAIVIFQRGDSEYAFLHEFAHAATVYAINANASSAKVFQKIYKDYKARSGGSKSYGFTNVKEFVSEAYSNPAFQRELKALDAGSKRSLWDRIVDFWLNLTNRPPQDRSAVNRLLEALPAVNKSNVLHFGKLGPKESYSYAINTTANEQLASSADIIAIKQDPTLSQSIKDIIIGSTIGKVRNLLTDKMASLDKKLWEGYGYKVRDALGNTNPALLLAQALDFQRIAEAVLTTGGLKKTADGMYTATELTTPDTARFPITRGRPVSGEKVVEYVNAIAQQEGKTYEQTVKTLSTLMYGHREAALLKHNQDIEVQALAMEAAGKQKLADKLRDENLVQLDFTPSEILAMEAAYNATPEAQEILEMMDAVRFNLIDNLVEAGRISEDKAEDWKEATAYVPFDRLDDLDNVLAKATGKSRGLQGVAAYRPFKGSTTKRQVGDIVNAFLALSSRMVGDAVKVNAVRRSLSDLERLGYAKLTPVNAMHPPGTEKHYVSTYIKGERAEFYVMDPLDVAAFAGMPTEVGSLVTAFQNIAKTMRAGVTLLPGFAFAQVAQDMVRAYTFSGVDNPKALVPRILFDFPKVALGELTGKKTLLVKELERLGIIGSYDTTHTNTVKNVLRESGVERRNPFQTLLHVGESLSKASDLVVRKAIYEQTLAETGDQTLAAHRAREIINFSRRGSARSLDTIIRTVPFFNAYLRGIDKLYTAATGEGGATGLTVKDARAMFWKRMSILTAMGTVYALMMVGDDDYEKQPDYIRDANIIFPGGKELGFTPSIPLPKDLALIFKAIPERVVSYYRNLGTPEERDGIQIIGQLAKYGLIDVLLSPNTIPVAIRPVLENMTNYSFFLGRPLESQSMAKMDAFQRKNSSTSESMAGLSEALHMLHIEYSPIKLENLFRGILGTTGGIAIGLMDMMVNPTRTDRPLHKDMLAQISGASTFMKSEIGTRQVDELYKLREETLAAKATYESILKENPEEADDYYMKHYPLIAYEGVIANKLETLSKLREWAKLIDKQEGVPPSERREQLNEILRTQNEVAQDVFIIRNEINKAKSEV